MRAAFDSGSGWGDALVVFRKEIKETLRDTRTLMMMVVVPVLLYPAILIASEQLALFGQRQLSREPAPVGIVGEVDPLFLAFLRDREDLVLREVGDPEEALRADAVTAVALFELEPGVEESRSVVLLFDAADDLSRRGRDLFSRALGAWRPGRRSPSREPSRRWRGRSSTVGINSGSTPLSSTPEMLVPWTTIISLMTKGLTPMTPGISRT